MAKRKPKAAPSSDEAALLAAARDSPDGTARGAYADWLEERGRPVEAAEWRASFMPTKFCYGLRHRPTGVVYESRPTHRGFKSYVMPTTFQTTGPDGKPAVELPHDAFVYFVYRAEAYWRTRPGTSDPWSATAAERTFPATDFDVVVERWTCAEVLVEPLTAVVARPARDIDSPDPPAPPVV